MWAIGSHPDYDAQGWEFRADMHKPHTKGHKIWVKHILYALCLYPNYGHFTKVWYLVLLWGDLGVELWRLGTLGKEFSLFPICLSCGFHILVNGGGNVIVTGGGKWIFWVAYFIVGARALLHGFCVSRHCVHPPPPPAPKIAPIAHQFFEQV